MSGVVELLRPETEIRTGPAANGTGSNGIAGGNISSVLATTLHHPKAIAPGYAVLLMRRDGHWRRQVFMSLHSATRALERAESAGREARMQLVELVPVPSAPVIVIGGGLQ